MLIAGSFPDIPANRWPRLSYFPEGQNTRLKLTHAGLETHDGKNYAPLARKNFQWGWNELGNELEKFLARDEAFVITRVFDAPRELVWQVWTDPKHLTNWWGPKGLTMTACKVDLRPGGLFHYGMKTRRTAAEMWGKFVYRQIDSPKKLVLVVSFSDAQGGTTRHPMSATWPLEVLNTMTLAEEHGKTHMTLHGVPDRMHHTRKNAPKPLGRTQLHAAGLCGNAGSTGSVFGDGASRKTLKYVENFYGYKKYQSCWRSLLPARCS